MEFGTRADQVSELHSVFAGPSTDGEFEQAIACMESAAEQRQEA